MELAAVPAWADGSYSCPAKCVLEGVRWQAISTR